MRESALSTCSVQKVDMRSRTDHKLFELRRASSPPSFSLRNIPLKQNATFDILITITMSHPTLRLPLRTLHKARVNGGQWICRRCLATTSTTTVIDPPPPPIPSRKLPSAPLEKKDPSEALKYDPHLPSSERDYRLTKTDFYLKKGLPQVIPHQYLQHSKSDLLPPAEKEQRDKTEGHKRIVGVVVSAGKMDKTVRVQVPGKVWNKRIKKVIHPCSTSSSLFH